MAQAGAGEKGGHVRYTYRLRTSSAARALLAAEWGRCRWVWNECVARSRAVDLHNRATGEKATCGPAQLDRMLTGSRSRTPWLREGSCVPQQQIIRDFGRARAKALQDVAKHLPSTRRAGMPTWKTRREALPTLNYTKKGTAASRGYRAAKRLRAKAHKKVARQRADTSRKWTKKVVRDHDAVAVEDFRPKFLARTNMARKAADAAIGATKAALIEMGRKHGRDIRLVHPAYTTMDCAQCGARAKHALPLGERTHTCTACGITVPRDKNSACVTLVRAGLNPADVDGARPPGALLQEAV